MMNTLPSALPTEWRELAEILHAEGCSEVARARERCANELETALHTQANEAMSIQRAAAESGYNEDYLRRMIRANPLLNAGRKNKPLIKRCDLPRKAGLTLVAGKQLAYDPLADAQSLMSRQGAA